MLWIEKFRPASINEFIGNVSLKSKVEEWIDDNQIPHLLLFGKPGIGKTTLAKIIINTLDCDFMSLNGSDDNSVEIVRTKIKDFASGIGFAPLKIVFIDEFDRFTPQAQDALKNIIEIYSANTRFIFTCNHVERISDAIKSRCNLIELESPSKKDLAVYLTNILKSEHIDVDINAVADIVNKSYPDIRACVKDLQFSVRNDRLIVERGIRNDCQDQLLIEIRNASGSNNVTVNNIRQIVANSKIRDFSGLYRFLYDNVLDYAHNSVGACILCIAEGQFHDATVVDKEINFMATIINILDVCTS